jgi:hypothetical protein
VTRRHSLYIGAAAVILVAAGAGAAPPQKGGPVETGPGTTAAARRYLEGRWSLLSFEVFPEGRPPLRLQGQGSLTYDAFGNLDVEIRVDSATASMLVTAGIPVTRGVISTSGRTAIDLQARTLTYFLEGQPPFGAPSGPLALNRPRHFQIDGNVLTTTTKGDDGTPSSIARWEKAQ